MTPEQTLIRAATELVNGIAGIERGSYYNLADGAAHLSDALLGFDKRAKFTIAVGDKTKRIAGYIVGSFGIARTRNSSSLAEWYATHLGTGMAMPGSFRKKSQAIAYAAAIEPLAPWQDVTFANCRDVVPRDISAQIKDAARQHGASSL